MLALLCGFGGGNFSSSMANISFFFPKERKGSALGVNAGLGNLGVSVVQFLVADRDRDRLSSAPLGGDAQTDRQGGPAGARCGRRTRRSSGCRGSRSRRSLAWFGMNDIAGEGVVRRPGGDLPAQAQLADVPALPGHLRLVHRLRRGFPAADQEPVPGGEPAHLRMARPAGRRGRASVRRLARRQAGRRARDVLGLRRDGARRGRGAVLPAVGCIRRQLRRLLRDVPGAVPRHRHRQRLDLPDDPGDLPDRAAARRGGQGRRGATAGGARRQQGSGRGARLHRRRSAPTAASSSPRATAPRSR